MRGTRLRRDDAILDHTTHRLTTRAAGEALYLIAVLNAPYLTAAFAACRDSGCHFVRHPWRRIPIPRYDGNNPLHRVPAGLAERAERIVDAQLRDIDWSGRVPGQVTLSKRLRAGLAEQGVSGAIDDAARRLLPGPVR